MLKSYHSREPFLPKETVEKKTTVQKIPKKKFTLITVIFLVAFFAALTAGLFYLTKHSWLQNIKSPLNDTHAKVNESIVDILTNAITQYNHYNNEDNEGKFESHIRNRRDLHIKPPVSNYQKFQFHKRRTRSANQNKGDNLNLRSKKSLPEDLLKNYFELVEQLKEQHKQHVNLSLSAKRLIESVATHINQEHLDQTINSTKRDTYEEIEETSEDSFPTLSTEKQQTELYGVRSGIPVYSNEMTSSFESNATETTEEEGTTDASYPKSEKILQNNKTIDTPQNSAIKDNVTQSKQSMNSSMTTQSNNSKIVGHTNESLHNVTNNVNSENKLKDLSGVNPMKELINNTKDFNKNFNNFSNSTSKLSTNSTSKNEKELKQINKTSHDKIVTIEIHKNITQESNFPKNLTAHGKVRNKIIGYKENTTKQMEEIPPPSKYYNNRSTTKIKPTKSTPQKNTSMTIVTKNKISNINITKSIKKKENSSKDVKNIKIKNNTEIIHSSLNHSIYSSVYNVGHRISTNKKFNKTHAQLEKNESKLFHNTTTVFQHTKIGNKLQTSFSTRIKVLSTQSIKTKLSSTILIHESNKKEQIKNISKFLNVSNVKSIQKMMSSRGPDVDIDADLKDFFEHVVIDKSSLNSINATEKFFVIANNTEDTMGYKRKLNKTNPQSYEAVHTTASMNIRVSAVKSNITPEPIYNLSKFLTSNSAINKVGNSSTTRLTTVPYKVSTTPHMKFKDTSSTVNDILPKSVSLTNKYSQIAFSKLKVLTTSTNQQNNTNTTKVPIVANWTQISDLFTERNEQSSENKTLTTTESTKTRRDIENLKKSQLTTSSTKKQTNEYQSHSRKHLSQNRTSSKPKAVTQHEYVTKNANVTTTLYPNLMQSTQSTWQIMASPITSLISDQTGDAHNKILKILSDNNSQNKTTVIGPGVIRFLKKVLMKLDDRHHLKVASTQSTTRKSDYKLAWKCRKDHTNWNSAYIIGMSRFLQNHYIQCNADEFLQKFKLSDNKDNLFPLFRYEYVCCELSLHKASL